MVGGCCCCCCWWFNDEEDVDDDGEPGESSFILSTMPKWLRASVVILDSSTKRLDFNEEKRV